MVTKPTIPKEAKQRILIKKKVLKEKGTACTYCNCNNPLMITLDHIVPKSQGGKLTTANCEPVCFVCNQLKGSLTKAQFKEYLKALKILFKLCKVKLVHNDNRVIVKFSNHHAPLGTRELNR